MTSTQGCSYHGISFLRRQESWVAVSNGRFYKIPRKSDNPLLDIDCTASQLSAEVEFRQAKFLAKYEYSVLSPMAIDRGCIVYPAISGPDMRDYILSGGEESYECFNSAMRTLAGIHAIPSGTLPDLNEYASSSGHFVEPNDACATRLRYCSKVLLVGGFEIRNFRWDPELSIWRFFDPHYLELGPPECDIGRFIVSILMINWGRAYKGWLWKGFSLPEVISTYEKSSGRKTDYALINFFLHENAAMRKHYAKESILRMKLWIRPMAYLYRAIFFYKLERWIRKNEL